MKILMCTNGQENAEMAIRFAGILFKFAQPEVTVISITRKSVEPSELDKECLRRASKILNDFGIIPKTLLREGNIVEEILKESKEGKYDMLVIGSRGYSNILAGVTEVSLGETAQQIILTVETSILVVKAPKLLNKIMICTDGSSSAEHAVHFWGKLKVLPQPRINIVNVIPEIYTRFRDFLEPVSENQLAMFGTLPGKRTEYLYRAKEILAGYGIEAKAKLREGHAAEEILKEAENDYDLIIMGHRGWKNEKKATAGRQARRVIHRAKIPIMVVKS